MSFPALCSHLHYLFKNCINECGLALKSQVWELEKTHTLCF